MVYCPNEKGIEREKTVMTAKKCYEKHSEMNQCRGTRKEYITICHMIQ